MPQYTWTGIDAKIMDSIVGRRIVDEGNTLLGTSTHPLDQTRDAIIAELAAKANANDPNAIARFVLYQSLGNPAFAIDTNFDVKNATAINYTNAGTMKQLAANANFNTGTTKTITASLWGAAVLSVDAAGAGTVTWASGAGYASEALAIAALTDPGATHTILGYVAVQAHASGFTAGTDALQGGTGGNVSPDTNYYNAVPPVLLPGA